jgi:hypothetical protein
MLDAVSENAAKIAPRKEAALGGVIGCTAGPLS